VNNLGLSGNKISCGIRLFFLFFTIIALTSHASGATGQLAVNPSNIDFGSVSVGNSQTQSVTLANSGGPKLTITQATLSGTGFTLSGLSYPVTLAGGQSVTCNVTFTPQSTGTDSGSVSIAFSTQGSNGKGHYSLTSSSSTTVTLPVSGTGVTSGQLTTNPTSLGFGSVQVGSSQTLTETLTNSGGTSVTISAASATGSGFTASGLSLPITLGAGQSVSLSVTFSPTSGGSVSGNLAITSNASNPGLNVALSGTGTTPGQLSPSPSSVAFGSVNVGSSQTNSVTLSNTGGTDITVNQATLSGAGFSTSNLSTPLTLHAGNSASLSVTFAPTGGGNFTGKVTFTTNSSSDVVLPISGTGVAPGQLTANPTSLAFGSVQVGNSSSKSETLTNTGGTAVTISQGNVSGAGFSVSGLSVPVTLAANQSVSFTVSFAPTTAAAASGTLAIVSDAAGSPLNIALSGTGLAPGSLAANPSSASFGNVTVGNNKAVSVAVTNTGGVAVTVSSAAASGSGFNFTGPTLPLTLNAGQSIAFSAIFAPTAAGAASGTLTINSDASNATLSVPLSGTGLAQGQLSPNPSSLSFGNVQVGSSKSLSETLTNSGGTTLTISAASASGSGFSLSGITVPVTLNAGQSTSFTVLFAPTASGAASGSISITSNGSNPNLSIPLSGTGVTPGMLAANPTSLPFGSVQVGNSSNKSETLTNTGGSAVTLSQANVTGAGFSVSGLTLPATLSSNQSVTFTVTFAPTSAGSASGTVSIVSDASNPSLSIALSGTGTALGQLAVSPTTLSFGNVVVGSSSSLNGTLNATGAAVTISSDSIANEFTLSGISLPVTVAAGSSASFTVTFTPKSSGAASGSLSFTSNATNSPTVQSLAGSGTPPPQHSVSLTWNSSANAVGYNVYRGTASGGPYSIVNSSLDASTAFTDSSVTAGQTYYYVTTAVDGNGNESGYSNEAQAVIPSP
jgi:hypothetical protein